MQITTAQWLVIAAPASLSGGGSIPAAHLTGSQWVMMFGSAAAVIPSGTDPNLHPDPTETVWIMI